MAHIYRAFTTEPVSCPPTSIADVVDGDGFAASIDGREYRFADFTSAVFAIKDALADRLLKELPRSLLLHAATVVDDHCTIIAVGRSGSGKTTVALELVRRGMRYVTDEFTAIDGMAIHPFPRSAIRKFDGPVPAGVNLEIPDGRNYRAYMLPDRRVGLRPILVKRPWLIFLSRFESGSATVRSISPGETCTQLMQSVFGIPGHETAMWPALADVATGARSCVLEYGNAERDLDLALDFLWAA